MGGAGGHMRHPHDLDEIKTGKDIIALFRALPDYLRTEEFKSGQSTSLKLDGSNNAVKVARRGEDGIQFAVDRASQNPLDVNGVTLDKVKQRFTKVDKQGNVKFNAGMAESSAGLIKMMEKTYRTNREEMNGLLERLGLIDSKGNPDPTKFINIEYIQRKPEDIDPKTGMGRANAIYYSFDSITFLNISQFYKVVRKGVTKRPGASRPMVQDLDDLGNPIEKVSTDVSVPIQFNKKDLDRLAEIAQPYAPEGFTVQGPSDLQLRVDHDAPLGASDEEISNAADRALKRLEESIEETLNSSLTIVISDQTSITESLEEWLEQAINFGYKPDITLADGTKKSPFHQFFRTQLVDLQTPLSKLVPLGPDLQCAFDGSLTDCEKAVYGAVFFEAARRLGNAVKQALQAKVEKFGNAVDNEGVVINAGMPFGDKVTSNTIKLTGEFIVDKDQGVYAISENVYPFEGPPESEEEVIDLDFVEDEDIDPGVELGPPNKIAIVPGAFKPPTRGHYEMVKHYSNLVGPAGEVIVLISKPLIAGRSIEGWGEITSAESMAIWELLTKDLGNVIIDDSSEMASSFQAALEYIGENGPLAPGTELIMGASEKPDEKGKPDWMRWLGTEKYIKKTDPPIRYHHPAEDAAPVVKHSGDYMMMLEKSPLEQVLPSVKKGKDRAAFHAEDMRFLIGKALEGNPDAEKLLTDFTVGKVNDLLNIFRAPKEEEVVSEMSAAGGGGSTTTGMEGYSGPLGFMSVRGPTKKKTKKKKKKAKQNENIDLSIVDEIMKLFIEKGLLQ